MIGEESVKEPDEKVETTETVAAEAVSVPIPGRGINFTPKSDWRGFSKDMHQKQWERKLNQHFRRLNRR